MSMLPSVQIVLDTLARHGVKSLLMGGQACISHGASEFTRDLDLAVLADVPNLDALANAMRELQADVIAVPPFQKAMLDAGHAVHFRCRAPGVAGLRVDVMSRMRGVDPFPALWERRTVLANGVAVLSLPDLVAAKKTQRDKDWPMLRRLLEADYFARRSSCNSTDVAFWLRECRTASLLEEMVARFPADAAEVTRPAVRLARDRKPVDQITGALRDEEDSERRLDTAYWAPLKKQLESMRARPRE